MLKIEVLQRNFLQIQVNFTRKKPLNYYKNFMMQQT